MLPAEVILVDDASGDGTRALLQEICSRYETGWIKLVLLDQNVGAGSARNAGWAVASQPLIAFLDADDAWHFKKIRIQYTYMVANPDVVMSGHKHRVVKDGLLPYWPVKNGQAHVLSKLVMLLSNRLTTPSVMLHRDISFRFLEGQRYIDDHFLWLQIICSGGRVVKLSQELVAIYKGLFGVTGLSSRIWLMERSELGNYKRLYQKNCINGFQFVGLIAYSILKYVRRLLIYTVYLRWKR